MSKLTKEQLAEIQDYIQSLPEEEREEKLKEVMAKLEQEPPQCPFCLMSEGKIQTIKIYEDENFLAVLEINPATKGHTILFPKRNIKSISELNEQETENLTRVFKKITAALLSISDGISIVDSEGKSAGQRFDHLTFNFIPRFKDDSVKIIWQGKSSKEDELNKIREKIIEAFPKEKPKSQPIDENQLKKEFYKNKKKRP